MRTVPTFVYMFIHDMQNWANTSGRLSFIFLESILRVETYQIKGHNIMLVTKYILNKARSSK